MRTRTSGPATPPRSPPRQQQAPKSRKRRSRSGSNRTEQPAPASTQANDPTTRDGNGNELVQFSVVESGPSSTLRWLTPRKAKRVRFSEPTQDPHGQDVGSTGLTPGFRRTRISFDDNDDDQPKRKKRNTYRRATLPPRLDTEPPAPPIVQTVQYAPLRQVIDSRMRRRLRRNHLSEELNEVDAQEREDELIQKEIARLRSESGQNEARIKDLMFDVESERQRNIQMGTEEEQHAQALQEELERLRREIATRDEAEEYRRRIEGSPTEVDEDEDLWDDRIAPSSPLTGGFTGSSSSPMQPLSRGPLPPSSPPVAESVATTFNTELCYDSHQLSEQVAHAERQASDARATLHLLHGELLALGFTDGSVTSEELIENIKGAFRNARLELEHLLPGETPGGFENVKLLPAMIDHIRVLIGIIRGSKKDAEISSQSYSALRRHFDNNLSRLAHLENEKTVMLGQHQNAIAEMQRKDSLIRDLEHSAQARAELVTERDQIIEKLEKDVAASKEDAESKGARILTLAEENREQHISIERLQNALGGYRSDVERLESLVNALENDLSVAVTQRTVLETQVSAQLGTTNHLKQALTGVATRMEHHMAQAQTHAQHHFDEQAHSAKAIKAFMDQKIAEYDK